MMFRLPITLCTLVSLVAFLGLTSPVLAGPTPSPPTATPATPTPATPDPTCAGEWPVATINTIGKGQKASVNKLVKHEITGNIIDPASYLSNAHRIRVCAGTHVRAVITLPGGFPATNTALGSLDCTSNNHVCEGTVNTTEVYRSTNDIGNDTDRMQLIPGNTGPGDTGPGDTGPP
jgi:hypothetical protein